MSDGLRVIIGLGKTGWSCARYMLAKGWPFVVMDTREQPPQLQALQAQAKHIPLVLGRLHEKLLLKAQEIIVSPGIPKDTGVLAQAAAKGIPVIGDIELLARELCARERVRVIAITGSNGKSTVTALVGHLLKNAGIRAVVGGNIGTPALDLLEDVATDVIVLELSSFQLETTYHLKPTIATVLNISDDHQDRYSSLTSYIEAKQRIYQGAGTALFNRQDHATKPSAQFKGKMLSFGTDTPKAGQFGLRSQQGIDYLCYGDEEICRADTLPIQGKHNAMNVLAAFAVGHACGLSLNTMKAGLGSFKGLAHRCQQVAKKKDVTWYNDSKGTNVGATLAAIEGLGATHQGKIVLIAGGDGKGADFSPLRDALAKYVRALIVIGRDGHRIAAVAPDSVIVDKATTMQDAVMIAAEKSLPGDRVLLSPACASFDMFDHYEHRGQVFMECVKQLPEVRRV